MYTPIALSYRAAIRVTVDGQHYYFTRQYFMAQFDRYVARQRDADSRPKLSKKKETPHLLQSIDDFLVASRSFDESVSKRWQWWFKVAGRTIEGGYESYQLGDGIFATISDSLSITNSVIKKPKLAWVFFILKHGENGLYFVES